MTPTQNYEVLRIANGWILKPLYREAYPNQVHDMYVARTPKELADLIEQWALEQTRGTKP